MICKVCRSKNRENIDIALIEGISLRTLQQRTQLSKTALQRHKASHLPQALAQSKRALELANSDNAFDRLNALYADAQEIKNSCMEARHFRTALMGVREQARLAEMLAQMQSKAKRKPEEDFVRSEEWIKIRTTLKHALEPYADASIAVAHALIEADAELKARRNSSGAVP